MVKKTWMFIIIGCAIVFIIQGCRYLYYLNYMRGVSLDSVEITKTSINISPISYKIIGLRHFSLKVEDFSNDEELGYYCSSYSNDSFFMSRPNRTTIKLTSTTFFSRDAANLSITKYNGVCYPVRANYGINDNIDSFSANDSETYASFNRYNITEKRKDSVGKFIIRNQVIGIGKKINGKKIPTPNMPISYIINKLHHVEVSANYTLSFISIYPKKSINNTFHRLLSQRCGHFQDGYNLSIKDDNAGVCIYFKIYDYHINKKIVKADIYFFKDISVKKNHNIINVTGDIKEIKQKLKKLIIDQQLTKKD